MEDNADYGGCPVMAKIQQLAMKDELWYCSFMHQTVN